MRHLLGDFHLSLLPALSDGRALVVPTSTNVEAIAETNYGIEKPRFGKTIA